MIIEQKPPVSNVDAEVLPLQEDLRDRSMIERELAIGNDLKQQQYKNVYTIGYTVDGCEGELGTLFSANKGREEAPVTILICDDGTRHEIPLGNNVEE